ncbi:peptidoglycan DD-metalloendopeptidase family protein [Frigoribacterium faeni]|uniref:M23 family metallopeptidase n=1 Tax=Frigoribacterium faeni TaxID=145483 RepID=UPI001FAD8BC6|nr:peptidoglycan DD-metalloendopeptidase family protein [Frigoribacterium faeni]MCJ0700807.1 peptidoglycan DD-metalloendopeptidase family protein [Frigoribacterium faeni]
MRLVDRASSRHRARASSMGAGVGSLVVGWRPRLGGASLLVLLVVMAGGADGTAGAAGDPVGGAPVVTVGSVLWSWPVAPPHPVVRPFVAPEHAWSPGHRGIDIGAAVGEPVLAPDDGVVRFAGTVVDRPVLSITHSDGLLSSFEPVTTELTAGDAVTRGDVVGLVVAGHSPDVDAVHLGARRDDEYVSPLLLLGGGRPSVLLPTRPVG